MHSLFSLDLFTLVFQSGPTELSIKKESVQLGNYFGANASSEAGSTFFETYFSFHKKNPDSYHNDLMLLPVRLALICVVSHISITDQTMVDNKYDKPVSRGLRQLPSAV